MMRWILALVLPFSLAAQSPHEYDALQKRLARGWNTWDVNSVTEQVLLPEGFTIRVGLKHNSSLNSDAFLSDALIGRQGQGVEQVFPGPHTWNGSFTELRLSWRDISLVLQSAHDGDDLVMLATPAGAKEAVPPALVFSAGVLWNRPGSVSRTGEVIEFRGPARQVRVYTTAKDAPLPPVPVAGPYFAAALVEPVGLSTGRPRTVEQIRAVLARERPAGTSVAQAIETVLGWDTIYEPSKSRVVSPVSRVWSTGWGGYVLFDWDTFFAASMAAVGDRDLAYADALETLREETAEGFVPNYARAGGWKSFDRSEPPVGAITVLNLYRQFRDRWFLRDAFDPLLRWNRWWAAHRSVGELSGLGDRSREPAREPGRPIGRHPAGRQVRIGPGQQPHVRRCSFRCEVAPHAPRRCRPDVPIHRGLRRACRNRRTSWARPRKQGNSARAGKPTARLFARCGTRKPGCF